MNNGSAIQQINWNPLRKSTIQPNWTTELVGFRIQLAVCSNFLKIAYNQERGIHPSQAELHRS